MWLPWLGLLHVDNVLLGDMEAPGVTQSSMSLDLLQLLQVLAELVFQIIDQNTTVLSILHILCLFKNWSEILFCLRFCRMVITCSTCSTSSQWILLPSGWGQWHLFSAPHGHIFTPAPLVAAIAKAVLHHPLILCWGLAGCARTSQWSLETRWC